MSRLFERIKRAVAEDRFVVSRHANRRLRQRGLLTWQVATGVNEGQLLNERLDDKPCPIVEVKQTLPDGTVVKAIWSWLSQVDTAKLVTVHYFDR